MKLRERILWLGLVAAAAGGWLEARSDTARVRAELEEVTRQRDMPRIVWCPSCRLVFYDDERPEQAR